MTAAAFERPLHNTYIIRLERRFRDDERIFMPIRAHSNPRKCAIERSGYDRIAGSLAVC